MRMVTQLSGEIDVTLADNWKIYYTYTHMVRWNSTSDGPDVITSGSNPALQIERYIQLSKCWNFEESSKREK